MSGMRKLDPACEPGRGPTRQTDKEIGDVQHVRGVPSRKMVHLVSLAALIADDVKQEVDRGICIVRSGAVSVTTRRQHAIWQRLDADIQHRYAQDKPKEGKGAKYHRKRNLKRNGGRSHEGKYQP
ncbi:hypothetical protein EIP86_003361 [Pleurotus ostreatoroseus]|nr:hypothetical protein EIP86_003361 [Pleurotus ostreatoroseus]